MAEFGLIKSFNIDNGELDGLNPQECFVLGYELAEIDYLLKQDLKIERPVHANNCIRIHKSCIESNRKYRLSWMKSDQSESWMWLWVNDK